MKNNDPESDEFDEFDDDDDDDDNDDDFHVEEDVYQSTASMENPRENSKCPIVDIKLLIIY